MLFLQSVHQLYTIKQITMPPIPKRLTIFVRDIMNITGYQERTARNLLYRIRKKLKKESRAFVTLYEFCTFTGLNPDQVLPYLV
jgi:hypothetical protein